MKRYTWLALLACLSLAGCLPRTTVRKNPGAHDCGVRYYRPKPYLFLKPMVNDEKMPVDGYVTIESVTLPDFSEEYSIHVRSGLGTNDTEITLTDGWNLTALNVNVDSQFDENVRAIADVVDSIPAITRTPYGDQTQMAVRATNVPLGLYEAVVSRGGDGKKRLYGFRYVGFMPYAPCPLDACGRECQDCHSGELYGLVCEDGAMVFRQLHEIPPHENLERVRIDNESFGATAPAGTAEDGSLMDEDVDAPPLDASPFQILPAPAPRRGND